MRSAASRRTARRRAAPLVWMQSIGGGRGRYRYPLLHAARRRAMLHIARTASLGDPYSAPPIRGCVSDQRGGDARTALAGPSSLPLYSQLFAVAFRCGFSLWLFAVAFRCGFSLWLFAPAFRSRFSLPLFAAAFRCRFSLPLFAVAFLAALPFSSSQLFSALLSSSQLFSALLSSSRLFAPAIRCGFPLLKSDPALGPLNARRHDANASRTGTSPHLLPPELRRIMTRAR